MNRLAVFASGRGSNFMALAEAARAGVFPGRIVLLLCDRPDAGAIETAERFGIPARVVEPIRPRGRMDADSERLYVAACREADVDWICLAGFMRIIGEPLLTAFPGHILNIHPSLLPAFSGLEAQRQAWEHGVRVSGCTVHLVDAGTDTGPIVMQKAVDADGCANPDELAARILAEEHRLYPAALKLVLENRIIRAGRRVEFGPLEGGKQ